MAFDFGGVNVSMKVSEIRKIGETKNFVIRDNFTGSGDYIVFLLDNTPIEREVSALEKAIKEVEISNYSILSCVSQSYNKADIKGNGITSFMLKRGSDWTNFINRKPQKPSAIMVFGVSLYSINGISDIMTDDFYVDTFTRPFYYMGHKFRKLDTYIFPVDTLREIFPTNLNEKLYDTEPNKLKDIGSIETFKTTFFRKQLNRIHKKVYTKYKPMLDEPKLHLLTTEEEVTQVLKDNMNAELVAWDIETTGLKFYSDSIICITISWNGIDGYFFPFNKVNKDLFVKNILSCKHNTGANPKFDTKFLWYNGYSQELMPTDAIDMLSHCIQSSRKRGLKPLACIYTNLGGYELKLDKYKEAMGGINDYSKIPYDILSEYAIIDAIATWRIQMALWEQVSDDDVKYPNEKHKEWTIKRWYETQCMPIYQEVIRTEYAGIYVNTDLMNKYRDEMKADIKDKENQLRKIWGVKGDFNLYSTPELGKLFEKLGFPCYGRNKLGLYSTSDSAIKAWIRDGIEGFKILEELRNEKTAMNSFLGSKIASAEEMYYDRYEDDEEEDTDNEMGFGEESFENGSKKQTGWLNYMSHFDEDDTDRICQSYNVMGTKSFRFIGKDPNFQNIPTRGKYAPMVKKCIDTPKDDLYIITSDSGIEYKLAAFEYILTDRGYVRAVNLTENDNIIENSEKPTVLKLGIEIVEGQKDKLPEDFWFRNVRGYN